MSTLRDRLVSVIVRAWRWIRPLPDQPIVPQAAITAPVEPFPETPIRVRRAPDRRMMSDTENVGQFELRRDVLDALPICMTYLKRMKKADPDGYALYRQIGAHVGSIKGLFYADKLEPFFAQSRPTFGAISFAFESEKRDEIVSAKFAYITKIKRKTTDVAFAASQGWSLYRVTIYYDDLEREKAKYGVSVEYYIAIDPKGEAHFVPYIPRIPVMIYPRKRKDKSGYAPIPVYQSYGTPGFLKAIAHREKQTPAEVGKRFFTFVANASLLQQSGFQVRATKGDVTACFAIRENDGAYFFKDRQTATDDQGRKQRKIFHSVSAHLRTVAGGEQVAVRTHFRGERQFKWNGYDVSVSVSGKHHCNLFDADFETIELADPTKPVLIGFRTFEQTGAMMRKNLLH